MATTPLTRSEIDAALRALGQQLSGWVEAYPVPTAYWLTIHAFSRLQERVAAGDVASVEARSRQMLAAAGLEAFGEPCDDRR